MCYLGGDRRKFQRLKVNLSVRFRLDEHFQVSSIPWDRDIDAQALDLSEEGMAIATRYDIPLYCVIILKFLIFKLDRKGVVTYSEPIEINGQVRSNITLNDKERRLGVYFKGIDSSARSKIQDYILSAPRHGNPA